MSETIFSTEFGQYLNPEKWGGHMIDDGDALSRKENFREIYGPDDRQSNRLGKMILKEALPQIHGLYPHRTYQPGMEFDASEHSLGTILLYKTHSLRTVSEKTARNVQTSMYYTNSGEPAMEPNFGLRQGRAMRRAEGQLLHTIQTNWGVVSETRSGQPTIVSVSQENVIRISSAEVLVGPAEVRARQTKLEIGKTSHFELPGEHEELEKISLLYICGYGKAKKARKTGKQLVNNLIPKPVINRPAIGLA